MRSVLDGAIGDLMIAQERLIREKVVGNAQITKDPHHRNKSVEIARKAALDPNVSKVYLNSAYDTATDQKDVSKKRPDVIVIKKDGTIDTYECTSSCQTMSSQEDKQARERAKIGVSGQDYTIDHPSRDPDAAVGGDTAVGGDKGYKSDSLSDYIKGLFGASEE